MHDQQKRHNRAGISGTKVIEHDVQVETVPGEGVPKVQYGAWMINEF